LLVSLVGAFIAAFDIMLNYQYQSSQQTLQEGLAEYFAVHEQFLSRRNLSDAAAEFFRCHDAVHVLHGCDLSLDHEAVVKISSLLGTNGVQGGLSVMRGYRLAESKEIYGELGLSDIVATSLNSLWLAPRTIWRCFRMRKRWPWSEFDGYLEQPLVNIRNEFGILVVGKGE